MSTCWRSECRTGCAYPGGCAQKPVGAPSEVAQATAGPTTHAHTREPQTGAGGFQWPCHKRKAHGPHVVTVQMLTGGLPYEEHDCTGVKAHPNTMIGRQ